MRRLLSEFRASGLELDNRVVMAPMTRSRAVDGKPDEMTAIYYAQRASAGLIISEGLPVSQQGTGYLYTPGIHARDQVDAWRAVTRSVHAKNGKIFAQLWHVGRVSHRSLQPGGQAPVSSVPIAGGEAFAYDTSGAPGRVAASTPQALDDAGIQSVIDDFRAAAANAIAAGFDGVEIHAANGYLIEQFLNPALNTRDDRYGGETREGRCRLLLDVVDAVAEDIGAEHVGVRLSPFNKLQGMPLYRGVTDTYIHIAYALECRGIGYVHLVLDSDVVSSGLLDTLRTIWNGPLILAGGLTVDDAERLIADGKADLVAFGTPFIANPDFVERVRQGWPLASADRRAFYGGGAEGYIDYPEYTPSQ